MENWEARLAQKEKVKRMNLQDLKKSLVQETTLQNGLDVKIKDVGMMDLAMDGDIPDTLSDLFSDAMAEDVGLDDMPKFGELVNLVCCHVIAEPKFSTERGDEDYIGNYLNARERLSLFGWANREADSVRPFRSEEG